MRQNTQYDEFRLMINDLEFKICENLLKTKKKANIKFKVEINDSFKQFLKKKYQINGRFKLCNEILVDFEI